LEDLTLGNDYVDDIDGMVDVTDGIPAAADGEALSPIRNLGERLVVLEHFFDDFHGNINWEEDDEDNGNGTSQTPIWNALNLIVMFNSF
jgi:hypothetical protein